MKKLTIDGGAAHRKIALTKVFLVKEGKVGKVMCTSKASPHVTMSFSTIGLHSFFIKFKCRNEHTQTDRNTMKKKRQEISNHIKKFL